MNPFRPIEDLDTKTQALVRRAMKAKKKAYAPYSHYRVGSVIVDSKGGVHSGCNVENSAYNPGICAERVAVFKMVSRGKRKIAKVIVAASSDEPVFPCGSCLQVIQEFGIAADVISVNDRGTVFAKRSMRELFPYAFTPEKLKG